MDKNNKLKLNAKPNYILFQNHSLGYHLPPLLLGVHINKNLNWNYQINDVYSKSSKMCGILYKVRNHPTTESMISIYCIIPYATLILYTVCQFGDVPGLSLIN